MILGEYHTKSNNFLLKKLVQNFVQNIMQKLLYCAKLKRERILTLITRTKWSIKL